MTTRGWVCAIEDEDGSSSSVAHARRAWVNCHCGHAGESVAARARLQHELALPTFGPVSHDDGVLIALDPRPATDPGCSDRRPCRVSSRRLRRSATPMGLRAHPTRAGRSRDKRNASTAPRQMLRVWSHAGSRLGPVIPTALRQRRNGRYSASRCDVRVRIPADSRTGRCTGHNRSRLVTASPT
jgi:hypothetical protein